MRSICPASARGLRGTPARLPPRLQAARGRRPLPPSQLQALWDLTVAIAGAEAAETIYEAAMRALRRGLAAPRAAVLRIEPWNTFRFVACDGLPPALTRDLERVLPLVARAHTRQPVFIRDLATGARGAAHRRLLLATGVRAIAVVPLPSERPALCKLVVYFDAPRRFASEDVRFAQAVAWYVALAMARLRTEAELRESREGLRTLSAHLESAREEERTRLARELHDELGQLLTSFKLDLSWLTSALAKVPGQPSLDIANKLQCMAGLTEVAISTVRQIASELRPPALDHLGLTEALRWEAGMFEGRTGIRCRVTTGADPRLDPARATAVFRIAQEALTNVARHAGAGAVRVALRASSRGVTLEVKDNGRGIAPAAIDDPHAVGLLGMRERARLAGGTLEIAAAPGRGTRVVVRMPIDGARHSMAPRARRPIAAGTRPPIAPGTRSQAPGTRRPR